MFLETLVDLVQTVVDLEPNCCEPLHVLLILGAYTATLSLSGEEICDTSSIIKADRPPFLGVCRDVRRGVHKGVCTKGCAEGCAEGCAQRDVQRGVQGCAEGCAQCVTYTSRYVHPVTYAIVAL